MNKRTSGPWHTYASTVKLGDTKGYDIRAAGDPDGRVCQKATREDANAISAVPELIAAAEAFLDMWHRAGPQGSHQFEKFDGIVRQFRAALDKSNGEQIVYCGDRHDFPIPTHDRQILTCRRCGQDMEAVELQRVGNKLRVARPSRNNTKGQRQ
jgi:hypothetical protein